MITIEGKDVFTELAELVDPAHTALIMVDMQCDFIEPDGMFGTRGISIPVARAAASNAVRRGLERAYIGDVML